MEKQISFCLLKRPKNGGTKIYLHAFKCADSKIKENTCQISQFILPLSKWCNQQAEHKESLRYGKAPF